MNVQDWLAVNKLFPNIDQAKIIIFHKHQKVVPTQAISSVVINNTVIESAMEFNWWD